MLLKIRLSNTQQRSPLQVGDNCKQELNLRDCNINNFSGPSEPSNTPNNFAQTHLAHLLIVFTICPQHWFLEKSSDNFGLVLIFEKNGKNWFFPHEYRISINPRLLGRHAMRAYWFTRSGNPFILLTIQDLIWVGKLLPAFGMTHRPSHFGPKFEKESLALKQWSL